MAALGRSGLSETPVRDQTGDELQRRFDPDLARQASGGRVFRQDLVQG
jgi:hypothetical protein